MASTISFEQYVFSAIALFALSVSGSTGHSGSVGSHADAERLKTGRFLYRTLMDGKDAGTSEISISKLGADSFVFTHQVRGAFAQQSEAVATAMFVPVSAKLGFGEGDKLKPRFELNYRDGHAIGWSLEKSTGKKIDIDTKVLPDTVDPFAAVRIAYSIKKSDHTEVYQVLTNVAGARILLKEEFPDGAVIELVRSSE
jgi:hypothetical protein